VRVAKAVVIVVLGLAAVGTLVEIGKNAPRDSAERANPPTATATRLVIRFDELRCYTTRGGMPVVEGTLTNASDRQVSMVNLRFRILTPDGTFTGYAEGHAEIAPIAPGQSSPFKALSRTDAEVAVCQADSAIIRGEAAVLAGVTMEAGTPQ
jgi:hypothetical protein